MLRIDSIFEDGDHIRLYLTSRQIIDQYKKAKLNIEDGNMQKYDFKIRRPRNKGIYSFRINKKYRAFGYFREDTTKKIFIVTEISDHQDF